MATLNATAPTLLDYSKRLDPNGQLAQVIEILTLVNPIMEDVPWVEANGPTGHRTTIRSGLPTGTWRKLYGGVQPEKSTTVQVTDGMGMLESYAEVDKALADLNGNTAAFRLSEDKAFIQGIGNTFCSTLVYGNDVTTPESFMGLAPRFNAISGATNGENVLAADASASGNDQSSIWLIGWGQNTVHGIYPKGSQAGLQVNDKGVVTVENADPSTAGSGRMEAYRTHYRWDCGLTVRDWRYIVRICNIDTGNLTKNAASGADLVDMMAQALDQIPNLNDCNPVFYASRKVKNFLRRQMTYKVAQSTLGMEEVAGKRELTVDGIPVKRCDSITNAESAIS